MVVLLQCIHTHRHIYIYIYIYIYVAVLLYFASALDGVLLLAGLTFVLRVACNHPVVRLPGQERTESGPIAEVLDWKFARGNFLESPAGAYEPGENNDIFPLKVPNPPFNRVLFFLFFLASKKSWLLRGLFWC